jgi:hypothetical protein
VQSGACMWNEVLDFKATLYSDKKSGKFDPKPYIVQVKVNASRVSACLLASYSS